MEAYLASVQDRGEWLASRPDRITPGKEQTVPV
jgi:hypothetical protein